MDRVLTEEQTRAAFAQLRADELGRFIPPGAAGVHRTVRRRRAGRAAASGLVAVAVLAVVAIAGWQSTRPTPDPRRPVLSAPQLNSLAAQAKTVLNGGDNATIVETDQPVIDMYSNTHGTDGEGDYQLQVACVGTGTLAVTFRVGATDLTGDVACGPAGTPPHTINTHVSSGADSIFISLRPDEAARRRAGFAYMILRTS